MDKESRMRMAKKRLIGFAVTCGLELDTVEIGETTGHCVLRPELLNPYGFVHGGAIDTVMDTLGGMTASGAADPPRYVVTRSVEAHYLHPVLGGMMRGKANVVKVGKQTFLIRAEVFDEQDRLCAEGLLEFFYLDRLIEDYEQAPEA